MTRKGDTFVPLESRTAFANEVQGDIFVSVHVNSSRSAKRSGIEMYYLSLASDEESALTAAFENASSSVRWKDLEGILKGILKGEKIKEDEELASSIQKALIRKTGAKDRGVRRAPFVVLVGTDMPSVLAEVGFISSRRERALLLDRSYRQRIAEGLAEGIKDYVENIVAKR